MPRDVTSRPCPICGDVDGQPVLGDGLRAEDGSRYRVVACGGCGLRYTDPLPTEAEVELLYDDAFYGEEEPGPLSFERLRLALHERVLRHRERALLGRAPGRILDIGCGDGDLLRYLADRGWRTVGTEISSAGRRRGLERGVEVHCGTLEQVYHDGSALEDDSFDAVTLWHVLEHVPDPRGTLDIAASLLRPGGILVLEVPDVESPTLRLTRGSWYPLDVPRHLQHFDPARLDALVESVGFVVERRQRFHWFDSVLAFLSFVARLELLGTSAGAPYLLEDFRRSGLSSKLRFLLVGGMIAALSPLYSFVATAASRHGETYTLTARLDR